MTDGWTRRLLRVKDLMDRAYGEPLGVPAMAELVFASADHFTRRFKQSFGETPHQYLLTRRMERAKALLRDSDLSVTAVCHAVGFTSLGSFSTRFFDLVGESPTAYRRRWQAAGDRASAQRIPMCAVLRHTRPLPKRSVSEKPPASPDR